MAFLQENAHRLVDILHPSVPGRVALSINNAVLEPAKVPWSTLALAPPAAKHMENYYFILVQGCFYSHLCPDSGVITVVNKSPAGQF